MHSLSWEFDSCREPDEQTTRKFHYSLQYQQKLNSSSVFGENLIKFHKRFRGAQHGLESNDPRLHGIGRCMHFTNLHWRGFIAFHYCERYADNIRVICKQAIQINDAALRDND
jgi:hypothetical protein